MGLSSQGNFKVWQRMMAGMYGEYPPAEEPPQQVRDGRKRRIGSWLMLSLLVVLGVVYIGYRTLDVAPRTPAAAASPAETATAIKTAATSASAAQFASTVNALIGANSSVDISVSLTDMQSGAHVHYGVDAGFQAASTAKLLTAAAYLHGVEQGTYSLDHTIEGQAAQGLLETMIVNSDDDAWQTLNDTLTHETLAAYASSLGIDDYNVTGNVLSSDDIALLLQKLQAGQLLNAAHTQLLLSYMKQANYRDFIVAGAPSGVTVYHKAGEIDDEVHDAAILTKDGRSIVLVIYTNGHGTYDWGKRAQLLQTIAAEAAKDYLGS